MIVVTDTGPLYYFFQIGLLDVLPALYGQVFVPRSIPEKELDDAGTPQPLRTFFRVPPAWLIVSDPPKSIHPSLAGLGLGEREAVSLLLTLKGDLLLCDDAPARKRAMKLGLAVIGTLGIIDEAAYRGLIDFELAIESITQKTNFRHTLPLIEQVRKVHLARRKIP